jgi:hypothetical protein
VALQLFRSEVQSSNNCFVIKILLHKLPNRGITAYYVIGEIKTGGGTLDWIKMFLNQYLNTGSSAIFRRRLSLIVIRSSFAEIFIAILFLRFS